MSINDSSKFNISIETYVLPVPALRISINVGMQSGLLRILLRSDLSLWTASVELGVSTFMVTTLEIASREQTLVNIPKLRRPYILSIPR